MTRPLSPTAVLNIALFFFSALWYIKEPDSHEARATFAAGVVLLLLALTEPRRLRATQGHPGGNTKVAPVRSPGDGLRRLAQLCFSKKTCSRVFDPALSDLWEEYVEALGRNDAWMARLVLVRGYGSFWAAFVAQLPVSLSRVVVELWKATKIG